MSFKCEPCQFETNLSNNFARHCATSKHCKKCNTPVEPVTELAVAIAPKPREVKQPKITDFFKKVETVIISIQASVQVLTEEMSVQRAESASLRTDIAELKSMFAAELANKDQTISALQVAASNHKAELLQVQLDASRQLNEYLLRQPQVAQPKRMRAEKVEDFEQANAKAQKVEARSTKFASEAAEKDAKRLEKEAKKQAAIEAAPAREEAKRLKKEEAAQATIDRNVAKKIETMKGVKEYKKIAKVENAEEAIQKYVSIVIDKEKSNMELMKDSPHALMQYQDAPNRISLTTCEYFSMVPKSHHDFMKETLIAATALFFENMSKIPHRGDAQPFTINKCALKRKASFYPDYKKPEDEAEDEIEEVVFDKKDEIEIISPPLDELTEFMNNPGTMQALTCYRDKDGKVYDDERMFHMGTWVPPVLDADGTELEAEKVAFFQGMPNARICGFE